MSPIDGAPLLIGICHIGTQSDIRANFFTRMHGLQILNAAALCASIYTPEERARLLAPNVAPARLGPRTIGGRTRPRRDGPAVNDGAVFIPLLADPLSETALY